MENEKKVSFQLLVLIATPKLADRAAEMFRKGALPLQYRFHAEGTATSEIMDVLGLGNIDKSVLISMIPKNLSEILLNKLNSELINNASIKENIDSIHNIINNYQVKFNNDIKGIQSSIEILNSFNSSLEKLDHLKEIDILWKNLYEIQNRMDTINKNLKASYIVGGSALVISILEFFIIWS